MQWKTNYNLLIYFQVNLLRYVLQQRQMKQTRKKKSFKKAKCRCNGKVIINFQVLYIFFYTYSLHHAKSVLNVIKSQH